MSKSRLANRTALVTGGARGIGLAIARDFIEKGAKVVIADNGAGIDGREPDRSICQSASESMGDNALAYPDDIATPQSAVEVVQLALDHWGRLDIVVNCAAILRDHFIFKANPQNFDEVLRVNLAGAYYILAAATPVFREQAKAGGEDSPYTWGRIVNIVSTAGFYGNYGQSAYASAKAGLMGLTRVAAFDLARSNVTVNAVAPFARSRVTEIIVPANDEQAKYKERALKIDPAYVATVVSWLCSDLAGHVTGQLFGVRGREFFLFSQPRPVKSRRFEPEEWGIESLSSFAERELQDCYTELVTDLEAFNKEPAV